MRVLVVDDDPKSVAQVLRALEQLPDPPKSRLVNFEKAAAEISSWWPHVVILDLVEGMIPDEEHSPGLKIRDLIWGSRFCPIIIYSANPGLWNMGEHGDHPFIKLVQKGARSDEKVITVYQDFRVHFESISEVESQIAAQLNHTLRNVAPIAFASFVGDPAAIKDAISRGTRRRLAASMDEEALTGQKMHGWEQYLHPPVTASLRLGDILKGADAAADSPSSYRIILTPSCDMVAVAGKRKPKVDNVLVATCCEIREALTKLQIGNADSDDKKKELRMLLTKGCEVPYLIYPSLPGIFPHLAANLKHLELIPIDRNGQIDPKFTRIASVDSPFRELVAWAYLQTSCRPGLPDRDFDGWRDCIIAECLSAPTRTAS